MAYLAVIVLAAGKGLRMKTDLPKVLHPIAGKTMLERALLSVAPLNPSSVTVVVGPKMEAVAEEARRIVPEVTIAVQEQQRGTGDAVMQGLPRMGLGHFEHVLVIYADTPFLQTETLKSLLEARTRAGAAVAVLGFEPEDPAQYGRLVTDKAGILKAIIEYRDASEKERAIRLCNSGVMAFSGADVHDLTGRIKPNNAKNEFYLTDTVAIAESLGKRATYAVAEAWEVCGVNSQAERAAAEAMWQTHLREKALEGGAILIAPETVFLSDDTQIAPGAIVHPYVVFGAGVKVASGAVIHSFSHIEGALIGAGAAIGPYARLRPGAEIGQKSKIGNFVEVKKATLGKEVKVSHLTYIGDAVIGDDTNIGAGTVTCNYDGVNKYQTEIGKGAFIGSNTSLVAPLRIGDGAVIGAGTTVLKDVPENTLAINPKNQENKKKSEGKKRA